MNAEEVERQAADWVVRRARPDWTGREEEEFEQWLNAATANRVSYLRLQAVWYRANRLASLRPAQESQRYFRRINWQAAAAAAVLVVIVTIAAVLGLTRSAPAGQVYATEVGGHRTVGLSDGSSVELNTGTQMRVTIDGHHRTAWLEHGEAYFEVARATDMPFVVYAGDQHVTVLGTKFSVRKDDDKVQVGVLEGRVEVKNLQDSSAIAPKVIRPGELLIAQGKSMLVAFDSMDRVIAALSWRRGMLVFSDTTLGEAIAEFNRYNNRKMNAAGTVAGIRIGGSFDATNQAGFVQLLQQGFGLRVGQEGKDITISN